MHVIPIYADIVCVSKDSACFRALIASILKFGRTSTGVEDPVPRDPHEIESNVRQFDEKSPPFAHAIIRYVTPYASSIHSMHRSKAKIVHQQKADMINESQQKTVAQAQATRDDNGPFIIVDDDVLWPKSSPFIREIVSQALRG